MILQQVLFDFLTGKYAGCTLFRKKIRHNSDLTDSCYGIRNSVQFRTGGIRDSPPKYHEHFCWNMEFRRNYTSRVP